MNRKQLVFLGVAAAVVAILAVVVNRVQSVRHEATPQGQLYPSLEAQLKDVTQVVVQRAGNSPVTVELVGNHWTVVEKAGYPADVERLRQTLIGLVNAKLVEAKTRNPDHYPKLGVQDVEDAEADAQRLDLMDGDGKPVAQVLIGNTGEGGGSYARRLGDQQSWLLSEQITIPATATDWLDKNVIQLDTERIQRVDVRPPEGTAFVLIKADAQQKDFELQEVPQGKRVKAGQPRRLAAALNRVTLDDVLSDEQLEASDSDWHVTDFKTFDGLRVQAKSKEVDGKHHLKLRAQLEQEDSSNDTAESAREAKHESENTTTEGVGKTRQEIAKEVEQLQKRFQGWTFVVPSYTANALNLGHDDMLEDLEETE